MTIGFIYVLTNDAMPDIVKVGKTRNDPVTRSEQLSSATGVPSKFDLYRQYEVSNSDEAEAFAHRVLEHVFGRPNARREFFSGQVEEVVAILDDALLPYIASDDLYSLTHFQSAINRVIRKEFTMGKMEFESLFRQIHIDEPAISANNSLLIAAGAYLACCYSTNNCPYHPAILSPSVKYEVMEKALDFIKEFEGDPTDNFISYVRSCS